MQLSHSELRHRILASLRREAASSVTSLAQNLGMLRPSVSRAVKSLEEAGLIQRTNRTISLNEAGYEELRRLNTELSMSMKKDVDLAARVILEQVSEASKQLEPLFNSQLMESLSPLVRIGEELSNGPILQISKVFSNNSFLQLGETLAKIPVLQDLSAVSNAAALRVMEVVKATAGIQTINLGLLQTWDQEVRSPLSHLVLGNNVLLSNMMVDLEAISKMGEKVSDTLASLINQIAWTTTAYDTYFADIVRGLQNQIPTFDSLELSLALPTIATASLVGSTRFIIESEAVSRSEREPKTPYTARSHNYSEGYGEVTPKLEAYLGPLGQRFINKWEGAWQTLYSGNKDRHSQAAHSGRELLMQVLAYLAPDSVFSKEDCVRHGVDKPNRKMRIQHILNYEHQSTVGLIDSMARTLDSVYDVLVGEAHRRDDISLYDDTIAGQLAALGGSLIMLLSLHSNTQN